MTPFQALRLWARRAPVGERMVAGVAAVAVVAVAVWLMFPAGDTKVIAATAGAPTNALQQSGVGASTGPTGQQATGGLVQAAAGQAGRSQSGQLSTGTTMASASSGGSGLNVGSATRTGGAAPVADATGGANGNKPCVSPPGSATGVSATQIKVAVTLINIVGPAANQTFGVKSASDQQADVQHVIDAINASGGIACRKIIPLYYSTNPVDQSDLHQKCLAIVQAGVFAVVDYGGESVAPGPDCFGQNHLPYFGSNLLAASEVKEFTPYMFDLWGTFDDVYHNAVFALRDQGFFSPSNGFSKLGFVYLSCHPELVTETIGWLNQAGVPSSKIVTYDAGCPSTNMASPGDVEQAILKFRQNGVTNVTTANFTGSFANFTNVAAQQGFTPKYGLGEDGVVAITYGNTHPDYSNMVGAVSVTEERGGEEMTPGMSPSAATVACSSIYQAHGEPSIYQQGIVNGSLSGNTCDQFWMLKAALEHAPTISGQALLAGLQAAKSVDFSYPGGPNDFSGGVPYGGQSWRMLGFVTACNCWRVTDPTFHPSYH